MNLTTSRSEKVTKSRRKLLKLTCVSGNIVFNFLDTKGIQLLTRSRWHWAISMSINLGVVFKKLLYIFAAWGVTFHSLLVTRWNSLVARYSLQNLLVTRYLLQDLTRYSLQNSLVARCRSGVTFCNFMKKKLHHRCFPVTFCKSLRTPVLW